MKKKKFIFLGGILVAIAIISTGIILAAPSLNLSGTTTNDTANLSWTNSDTEKSYNYDVKKSVNGGDFTSLTGNEGNEVKVLNVYPDAEAVSENITFTTYDGENVTVKKSASLKQWMEAPNSTDSRGYGRGLIEVTPVAVTEFNNNPGKYLYKQSNGEYNYQVVVFGTWDSYAGQDISSSAAAVMKQYLAEGNSCVMGHDTIRGDDARAANFATLRSYFNIKTVKDDGVTLPNGTNPGNLNGANTSSTTSVTLKTNNVFTTYPWYIGKAGTVLTVPHCHDVQQVAYGNIEMMFTNVGSYTDQNGKGQWNYYLTVNNNCAMIQTGHSSGAATQDEQKIWANLLFYLGDVNTDTTAVDSNFKDINAPNKPTISSATLNGLNGTVKYTAKDNGTTYKYYVEASERTTLEKATSNTISKYRETGVAGYSYVVDNKENTEPDNTIDTTSTTINYTLGNGPKTYLHIKTIDGAGNVSGVTHVLLHENVAPTLELSQNPTEWTNGNVTITATAADTDGSVVSIKKPDGTVENAASTTYEVEQNGTYEFIATDNSGATATKTIKITNIDKVPPQGTPSIEQPTSKRRTAKITLKATDNESGVAKIILPDGTEVTSTTAEYEVTVPDTYTFKVIDVAGNETVVDVPVTIVSDGLEVKYIDQVTKDEIADSTPITGNVGDDYTTSAKTIDGYTLVVTPQNKDGKLTMDKITVTYEYRKLSNVTVKYIDENTGKEIPGVDEITTTYKQGDSYTTELKDITGYTYTRDTDNTRGTVARENIEVVYYYKKTSQGVVTRYIDQVTQKEIADSQSQTGLENDNYTTTPATVDGYELVLTPANAKGKMTPELITVTYEYRKLSNVVVKYIDENTGVEIPSVDEITTTYKEGDSYTTEKKDIPNYTYTKDTKNLSGTVGRENIEVVYYYKKTSQGVVTKYIDQVTKEEIAPSQSQTGLENDDYTTTPAVVKGYELVLTPDNAKGKMTPAQITVTYEYRKLSDVTVKYIDENTGAEIPGVDEITTTYKQGERYTTEKKTIDGYTYTKDTNNTTGVVERMNIEVVYYYKKTSGGVLTKYIDQVTKKEIAASKHQAGLENDEYTTSAVVVEGYELVLTPDNAKGKMTPELTTVTYEYRKQSNVTVKYVDENTGKELLGQVTTTYKQGDPYTTEKKAIDGYTYTKDTGNVAGTVERENIEVVYYYKRNTKVVVKYIDEVTKEEIIDSVEITGLEKDPYETEEKEKAGYELVGVDGNTTGKMTVDPIEVTYKYRKNANLITKHIDKNSGEKIVEDVVKKYKEGDKYEALPQNIAGYVLVESPEETTGTMGRENVEKTFYYKKISGGLVVKYVDKITGELLDIEEYTGNENDLITFDEKTFLHYVIYSRPDVSESRLTPGAQEYTYYYVREAQVKIKGINQDTQEVLYETTISGLEGNEYTTEPRIIDGCELVKVPENKNGIYSRNSKDVIYEYKQLSRGVTVRYIDKETGEEIADEEKITGYVGDTYQTEKKTFEKYNFVEVKGDEIGSLEAEEKEVTYYYEKKTGEVEVVYVDENGEELLKESLTGKVDEEYKVVAKTIKNYRIKEVVGEEEGVYELDKKIVKYVMEKIPGRVIVNLLDGDGNVLDRIEKDGFVGEKLKIDLPEKEGYYIKGDKTIEVDYKEGEIVINVEYIKIEPAPETGDINVLVYALIFIVSGTAIAVTKKYFIKNK